MRTSIITKTALLLAAFSTVASVTALVRAVDAPAASRLTPPVTQPAPLPGDMPRANLAEPSPQITLPSEELPLAGEDAGYGQVPFPYASIAKAEASDTCPCPTVQMPCTRCGCRHSAPCGQMPFGATVNASMKAQICSGLRARMVLYHYDFCDGTAADGYKLSERGTARLRDIARMYASSNCYPIVIESTPCNAALDAARREYVVKLLNQTNASVPDVMVIVGRPETPPMSGHEAVLLSGRLLWRIQQEGQSPAPSPSPQSTSNGTPSSGSSSSGSSSGR